MYLCIHQASSTKLKYIAESYDAECCIIVFHLDVYGMVYIGAQVLTNFSQLYSLCLILHCSSHFAFGINSTINPIYCCCIFQLMPDFAVMLTAMCLMYAHSQLITHSNFCQVMNIYLLLHSSLHAMYPDKV